MQDVMLGNPADLAAFVRNRYFYGKLLDVSHLEMEQRYLNEKRWLVNRQGLGTGVLCGLDIEADGRRVIVGAGVAIDGHGREIVVPEPFVIEDPLALTDDCGRPTGEHATDTVTLCLAFHECDVDPTPVLVADCDVREECRPGAVRERFRVLVHDGLPDLKSPLDCDALGGGRKPAGDGGDATHGRLAMFGAAAAGDRPVPAAGDRPVPADGGTRISVYRALCDAIEHGCAAPEHDCVPIGVVRPGGDPETLSAAGCGFRVPIYSNVVLLDLIICIAGLLTRILGTRRVLRYEVGDAASVDPGTDVDVAATLLDETGSPVEGETVTFRVRAGAGTVGDGTTFDATYDLTSAADGRVSAVWRLGDGEGLHTLEAGDSREAPVVFHALARKGD
jgi:hypothetical protein